MTYNLVILDYSVKMKYLKIMSIGNSETFYVQTILNFHQKFDRFGRIYTNSNQFREMCVCVFSEILRRCTLAESKQTFNFKRP